ncbi:MAG: L-lactate permease, partial [Candidatus Heimdallarchaeota archaeon]|nr:L-lactate permease [Candidatus Heimdallarchaeota archaeon]MCK4610657.1 L-lactate permease [Candidatus Heimdallarchaeota archaeon]
MSLAVDVLLILVPFVIGIILLVFFKFKADTVGTILIILMLIIGIFYFLTEWKVALLASLAGIIKSFPISLMVLTSILMITYQQKTGALDKIVVSFKKIGGGNKAFQIMMINLAIGCFLVSIGATPVTMLPPVLMAMGYSAFASVALPAIGYDPLTTYALLAVPAEFFAFFMKDTLILSQIDQLSLLSNHIIEPELVASGIAFSFYMPLVTIGIALGMLWLGGGRKLLFSKDGIIFGLTAGITAGGTAILANLLEMVKLTGVIAGIATALALIFVAKLKKLKIVDASVLTDEEKIIDRNMPLWKALSPWIFLIVFVSLINFITPLYTLFNTKLLFTIKIGTIIIDTKFLSHAYFWVLIAIICSTPFLGFGKKNIKETLKVWGKRSLRPVYAAAIFFGIAFIIIYSGTSANGYNMITALAGASSFLFGNYYPLIVPFIGLFGGFISGSETSAIAMFSKYHETTASALGLNAVAVGTANGVGGGLASVLSPAKIQNAAAVIDKVGIEGEVIKKA